MRKSELRSDFLISEVVKFRFVEKSIWKWIDLNGRRLIGVMSYIADTSDIR